MACVEPPAATAVALLMVDADAADAATVEESVNDEDLECEGLSFVVDAVVEDVVDGIKESS